MATYQNILVAVDFSEAAIPVIDKAVTLAQGDAQKLTIIHVVEFLTPIETAYEPTLAATWSIDETELVERARNNLMQLCKDHDLNDARQIVVVGIPKVEITDYATGHDCDLIVIGSHGRHGIELLLGSTANGVLHRMSCDVLAVKISD